MMLASRSAIALFYLLCTMTLASNSTVFAEPVLFFTDITNGPKTGLGDGKGSGAIVTVWGRNLGNAQGTSKVYCNGKEAAYIYYWGNADGTKAAGPADLYTYHKMQTISFSIPASVADGSVEIKVTVDGVESNPLPFFVRKGSIKYVKTTGSDMPWCGSWSSPCASINNVTNGAMKLGDIWYVGDGVIDGKLSLNKGRQRASATNSCAIIAYPGSTVLVDSVGNNYNAKSAYWVFSKLTSKSDSTNFTTMEQIRLIGNELTQRKCADGMSGAIWGQNWCDSGMASGVKVLGNYIHDYGCDTTSKFQHIFYITPRTGCIADSPELGWNYLRDNKAPHALHVYDEGKGGDFRGVLRIHDNAVVNQVGRCIDIIGGGATGFHMPIEIFNNLCVNTGLTTPTIKHSYTVITWDGASNFSKIKFYNNTIYGFGTKGAGFAIDIPQNKYTNYGAFAGTWEMKNNIFVDTMNRPWEADPTVAPAASSHNIWYSTSGRKTPPTWDTNPKTVNPLFANPAAGDFRLQANSPALTEGTSAVNSVVSKDLQGTPRSIPFGIGALQQ